MTRMSTLMLAVCSVGAYGLSNDELMRNCPVQLAFKREAGATEVVVTGLDELFPVDNILLFV